MSSGAIVVVSLLALFIIALSIKAVLWVGQDARRRGIKRVWLLQLLCVLQFPWPFLMYYFVTRELDGGAPPNQSGAGAAAIISPLPARQRLT